jgi:hypothetical protein
VTVQNGAGSDATAIAVEAREGAAGERQESSKPTESSSQAADRDAIRRELAERS